MSICLLTEKEDGAVSTILIRGSTDNLMDDIERAVDDGVNTFKVLTRVSNQNVSVTKTDQLEARSLLALGFFAVGL